jgi:hypothetical protein
MPSSGLWSCVDLVWTDVSEEVIASIFRVESEEPEWAGGCNLHLTDFQATFFIPKVITILT